MSIVEHTVELKLGPELSKDLKLVADLCFDGNVDEALKHAVVTLVNKEKLLCHMLGEKYAAPLMKVIDKFYGGTLDIAVVEATRLLLEKHQVSVDE